MFGSVVRSKFAMIVAAPIIATVAIIGTSSLAFAAQPATAPPVVVSFTASSTSLTYLGGKVALTASLEHAISCTVTVTPGLKGFPESFPCSKTVTTRFSLRRNKTATALSYSFALQVRNKAASVEATPVVVAEAALPAPVVSSFTATAANLPYTGGKVVLIAGFAYGSSCDMAVTPALRGFPKSFACTTHLRIPVTLGSERDRDGAQLLLRAQRQEQLQHRGAHTGRCCGRGPSRARCLVFRGHKHKPAVLRRQDRPEGEFPIRIDVQPGGHAEPWRLS